MTLTSPFEFEDALGLHRSSADYGFQIRIGDVDLTLDLSRASFRRALRELPRATIVVNLETCSTDRINYMSPVTIYRRAGDQLTLEFTGSVVSADIRGKKLQITSISGTEFEERRIAGMATAHVSGREMIFLLARVAGFPPERINVEGLERLPLETFEVSVPVDGVVPSNADVGSVRFVSSTQASSSVRHLANSELAQDFLSANAYAVVYTTASRLLDAERRGTELIERALAWLIVRSRYSTPQLPDGNLSTWNRSALRQSPKTRRLVAVRGLLTGRSVLRIPGVTTEDAAVDIDDEKRMTGNPRLPLDIPQSLQQALLACQRAASTDDPHSAITAIWEALEFYTAGSQPPELFDRSEIDQVREALSKDFSGPKAKRIREVIGRLNQPPFMARLRHQLSMDGVPLTQGEFSLLQSLRRVRNSLVHGSSPTAIQEDQISQGVSLVSRMLVYRVDLVAEDTRR